MDVAIGNKLTFLDAKNFTHSGIRVNRVALVDILQFVKVNISAKGTSDISRGHLAALSFAKEGAQLILKSHRGSEDGRTLLFYGTIILLLGATTTTTSILDLLGDTLLKTLKSLDCGNSLVAETLVKLNKSINLLLNRLGLNAISGSSGNSRCNGGRSNGARSSSYSSLGLGLLLSSRSSRSSGSNGSNRSRSRSSRRNGSSGSSNGSRRGFIGFLETRLGTELLEEVLLIVLVPVEVFDIIKRTVTCI